MSKKIEPHKTIEELATLAPSAVDSCTVSPTERPQQVGEKRKKKGGNQGGLKSKKTRAVEVDVKPVYLLEGGLRKVQPYDYVFSTYAKARWYNVSIMKVFAQEFNYYRSPIYYRWLLDKGKIRVNGEMVSHDYTFKNSDLLETWNHRHEPPVLDKPIEIVADTDDLLVVSKPCSYPVHPTGKYRHNTLLNVLMYEMGYGKLHIVNRIDRLTSGLVLMTKTKEKAAEMGKLMEARNIQKTYLARVRGEFPDGTIECSEPIGTISQKLGIQCVVPDGKPSTTVFTRLSYNGTTSLVKCEPKTGRTHQIRVHLQFLGHPIANDPHYNAAAWSSLDQSQDRSTDQFLAQFQAQVFPADNSNMMEHYEGCIECRDVRSDPLPEMLHLWLHSLRYQGDGWSFETPYPDWAREGWTGDCDIEERFWNQGGLWDGRAPGEFLPE
ncbi:RNA pseudouridylate synthase domain containing protein 2 [Kappamyces sp. JEL0829]|nr:RNA pseudouridylate synthase domain containing protein 2 [Kappamyces sp. JEL0829]